MEHDDSGSESGESAEDILALVGSPNVGKSVMFGELAETYVDVSNYPGTTVETTVGKLDGYQLTDTPGAYGVSSFNEEERVTREIVLEADAVVNVVDATHLDRDLFLTLQLLDMGIPTVVALNMMDEAEAEGITIDVDALEERLGVPVVPTVAVDGKGIDELRARIPEATAPNTTPIADFYGELPEDLTASRAERTLLIEGDERTVRDLTDDSIKADGGTPSFVDAGLRDEVYSHRRSRIQSITDEVQEVTEDESTVRQVISDLMVRPLTGTPIALALLGGIFYFIGVWVAQTLVGYTEGVFFAEYYNPIVTEIVSDILPSTGWADPVAFILLNDNLGLLTITVQYVVGVLLPLVVAFYLVIGLLEDSGVLPRLAVLTDRGLNRIGLNGRAVVPMIVGVGCVTMAVITTRMVGSRRERIISTALLGLVIPCSAQIGVIMGLLAGLGLAWWAGYLAVLLAVLGVAGLFLDRTLPGEQQALSEELPRLRVPRFRNIGRKTYNRTKMFLSEASLLFAGTALVISTLDYVGILETIVSGLRPVTGLLDMPASFAQILLLGIIRRDFAAAGMTDLALTNAQTFVGLVVITLFVPCILSMVMIAKERNFKAGALMWLGSWATAFIVGGGIAFLFGVIGL